MDEFVHTPKKPFRPSPLPKVDQVKPIYKQPVKTESSQKYEVLNRQPKVGFLSPNPLPADEPIDNVDEKINIDVDKIESPKEDFHIKTSSKHFSKKKLVVIISIIIFILALTTGAWWFFVKNKKLDSVMTPLTKAKKTTPSITPTPKPISPLTGIELSSSALANRPVTGLMIENSYESRPQSGLKDAGIIFEAIAEGGITRFLALYQDAQPQYIGPVRSIRPYFIDFALPFNAAVGHVGGSPDALNDIKALGLRDLDQFANGDSYWRISERSAPHNVYTSFEKLDTLNTAKGFTSSKFSAFERKPDVPQTPTASLIDFSISSPLYSPRFQYDTATNSYKRSQDGDPHVDEKSGSQLSPKVVIALVMNRSLMADGSHTVYQNTGSNKMFVFQDGIVSEGSWQKSDRGSQFIFTDKNGLIMRLNAGQTWISIVDNESDVSYRS